MFVDGSLHLWEGMLLHAIGFQIVFCAVVIIVQWRCVLFVFMLDVIPMFSCYVFMLVITVSYVAIIACSPLSLLLIRLYVSCSYVAICVQLIVFMIFVTVSSRLCCFFPLSWLCNLRVPKSRDGRYRI